MNYDKNNIPAELMELPLRELITRYGSLPGIERYGAILKDLAIAAEKNGAILARQKNQAVP